MKYHFTIIVLLIAAAVGLDFGGYKADGVWVLVFISIVGFIALIEQGRYK
jgi:hypothetical protein